jgi:hypothetical protein
MSPDGRLGVRTASILNLYNGATFEHFYQDKQKEYRWTYTYSPKEYYDTQGRLWMKEAGYLLLLDLNTNQFVYTIEEELRGMGIRQKLKNMFLDDSGNYWFIAEDNTVSFYDISTKELLSLTAGDSEFTKRFGVPRELTQYGNDCWIVYSSGLIRCWDYAARAFVAQDNLIDNLHFSEIDILEHDEDDRNYQGCIAFSVSDHNLLQNISFENVRIEQIQEGQLLNLRILYNERYSAAPGIGIKNIRFKNISYTGQGENPSIIEGFSEQCKIEDLTFENIVVNGKRIKTFEEGNIQLGSFTKNIRLK